MQQLRQIATFYRAALLLGIVSGDDVIAWADDVIGQDANAPASLIDLSIIPPSDLSELRHALQPLTGDRESLGVLRALFDRARNDLESGRRDANDTITVLRQARSFFPLPSQMSEEVALLQNDFMLSNAGIIGNTDAVIARLHAWLAPFAGSEGAFFEEETC